MEIQPLLLEIAELMRTGLAQLVAAAEPAEFCMLSVAVSPLARVGQCDGGDGEAGTGLQIAIDDPGLFRTLP